MLKAKNIPPCARFAVVSNPGTIFERIEEYASSLDGARESATCYDDPVDVMRVKPTGELTTEF
ncbi:hypothetical protein PPGU19_011560 [Paraburkholderia sp. PGU19]|uniref:hypothetical protein n=1 Tax=Paraburkholderia sp. PGU19 TaxID=2735434 RepID=UPI0015D99501|nr:hypothetical protein [Paraburkholderia sp. PGU19]BCF96587.1 hypothetical protein PPGU19_011560 [Paraburkholderia sp. PGU19]